MDVFVVEGEVLGDGIVNGVSVYDVLRLDSGFVFSVRRRHAGFTSDWSTDVCSSDLYDLQLGLRHTLSKGSGQSGR